MVNPEKLLGCTTNFRRSCISENLKLSNPLSLLSPFFRKNQVFNKNGNLSYTEPLLNRVKKFKILKMKDYFKQLSEDEKMKKEFETAINNAANSIAEKYGFDPSVFQEKDYVSNHKSEICWTSMLYNTRHCCN